MESMSKHDETIGGYIVGKGSKIIQTAGSGKTEVIGIVDGQEGHFTMDGKGKVVRYESTGGSKRIYENINKDVTSVGEDSQITLQSLMGIMFDPNAKKFDKGYIKALEYVNSAFSGAYKGNEGVQRSFANQMTNAISSVLKEGLSYNKDIIDSDKFSAGVGIPKIAPFQAAYQHGYLRQDENGVSVNINTINKDLNDLIDNANQRYEELKELGITGKQAETIVTSEFMKAVDKQFHLTELNKEIAETRHENSINKGSKNETEKNVANTMKGRTH